MPVPTSVSIRRAEPDDAPALARLRYRFRTAIRAATEPEAAFVGRCESWMAARLRDASAWRCWVASDAGDLVGTVWLQLIEKVPNPVGELELHGYISNMYVVPDRRGSGLGSALLGAALDECRAQALDTVFLFPTPEGRPLYERHGFAAVDDALSIKPTRGTAARSPHGTRDA